MAAPAARLGTLAILLAAAGCAQTLPDRTQRMTRGYIYYLDGAGGGRQMVNYSAGIRQGLLDAGYDGAGEMFTWQTGLGMAADQQSSIEYKRSKAAQCAQRVQACLRDHPAAPVTLIGMSAGTAVAVYVLEALPSDCQVESVVLLSASVSADHDLTAALRRVRGRMFVTTSDKDAMLAYLVPLAGTADRQPGTVPSAGLRGFDLPPRASDETRTQYAKLVYLRWSQEFARLGDEGRHFDTVGARFVQVCIAPLIMRDAAGMAARQAGSPATAQEVPNPDYERWSRFPVGSWVTLKGTQTIAGAPEAVRVQATLISRQPEMLMVQREYSLQSDPARRPIRIQGFFVPARIDPAEHPLSDPAARIDELPPESISVAGASLICRVQRVQTDREYPEYGRGVTATVCQNDAVPGGLVRVRLESSRSGQPFAFHGEVEAYGMH